MYIKLIKSQNGVSLNDQTIYDHLPKINNFTMFMSIKAIVKFSY